MREPVLCCPACGYDMTGGSTTCPECGGAFEDAQREVAIERAKVLTDAPGYRRRLWTVLGAGVLVCAVGVGVLAGTGRPLAAVGALVFCSIASVGAWATGAVLSRWAAAHLRPLLLAIWERYLLWLHVPWLLIPACTVLLFVGGFDPRAHGRWHASMDFRFPYAVFVLLLAWVGCSFSAICVWLTWSAVLRRRCGVNDARLAWVMVLAGMLMFLGATALGFVGGAIGTAALAGPDMFD